MSWERRYLLPAALHSGPDSEARTDSGLSRRLAGGWVHFEAVRILTRNGEEDIIPVTELRARLNQAPDSERLLKVWHRLSKPRPKWSGFRFTRPTLMGILNTTPDSFSDGGKFAAADAAIQHGKDMLAAGADMLDIGGESTRPGSEEVPVDEEIRRILPVIEGLRDSGVISVDTRKKAVIQAGLDAGATIVNDVSGLTFDSDSMDLVSHRKCPTVIMHSQGTPDIMQDDPDYDHVLFDIYDWLEERLEACRLRGMDDSLLMIDPGIGFGKSLDHNLAILKGLALFHGLGVPLLVGLSRKSIIDKIIPGFAPHERLGGSIGGAMWLLKQGVQVIRAHDIAQSKQAMEVWQAINSANLWPTGEHI